MCNDYDIVKYVEENFGVELFECQKEMLRQMKSVEQLYIVPARHSGFSSFKTLAILLEEDN